MDPLVTAANLIFILLQKSRALSSQIDPAPYARGFKTDNKSVYITSLDMQSLEASMDMIDSIFLFL